MIPPPGNVHIDEAIEQARNVLQELLHQRAVRKAVLINDLFGRIRVAVWPTQDDPDLGSSIAARMSVACKALWSGPAWIAAREAEPPTEYESMAEAAWQGGAPFDREDRLRINDRHRSRTSWFVAPAAPPGVPPLVVAFYSFKGGVGRTTAAAALALTWARRGRRIAIIDFDLDAPGLGRLLDADGDGTTARWGVVDYLLERGVDLPLDDYRHTCARAKVTGDGVIDVYPAGCIDEHYISKLGKLDLEIQESATNPLAPLLASVQADSRPDVVLIDSRSGLSPAAGLVLGGLAHLHVIISTAGEQALDGLRAVVRRLGEARIHANRDQAECVLVQSMIPDHPELGARAVAYFNTQAEDIFRDHYYAVNPVLTVQGGFNEIDDEHLWTLADLESSYAPHRSVGIRYKTKFADFRRIDDIADELVNEPDYVQLVELIDLRLRQFGPRSSTEDSNDALDPSVSEAGGDD